MLNHHETCQRPESYGLKLYFY